MVIGMALQANEVAVLRALMDGSTKTVGELQAATQLDHAAVARAALSLKNQGLAKVTEESKLIGKLTPEGERVRKEGLPEVKLLQFLANKTFPLEKIKIAQRDIAIGWAKSKGWIQVTKEGVRATLLGAQSAKKEPREIALMQNLATATKQDLELLRRRKFVDFEEKILRRVQLTSAGIDTARKVKPEAEVSRITPEMIRSGAWKTAKLRKYNIGAAAPKTWPGKKQPYRAFLDEVKKRLLLLGFKEMTGPLVELEFWNFDALYQPQNHPARDWTSTYHMAYPTEGKLPERALVEKVKAAHESGWTTGSTGWGYQWNERQAARLMPRAHGTALSARWLAKGVEIPGKYFAIARVFRPDILDAKHLIEFNQVEGIVVDESLNFRNLLGILKMFATEIGGAKEVRFAPSYFPFTEPSVELYAKHPKLGWIELGGAGIFREELTKPLGVKAPAIAWGLGIDRIAMFKLGIDDIRQLFSYDLSWLRNEKLVRGI